MSIGQTDDDPYSVRRIFIEPYGELVAYGFSGGPEEKYWFLRDHHIYVVPKSEVDAASNRDAPR